MQHFNQDTPVPGQRSLLFALPAEQVHQSRTGSSSSGRQSSERSRSPDDLFGNWSAALHSLAARRGTDRSTWKPTVPTNKLVQRLIALQVCGWSVREEELTAAVKR
jgi:hypothetical protein